MAVVRKLDVLLNATTDKFGKGLKSAEGMISDFNAKASKLIAGPAGIGGALGGAIAGVSLTAGIAYAVKQFVQVQEAQLQLKLAFKSTGYAAEQSVQNIAKYAGMLQQSTRFSKATTEGAAAGLAQFTNIKGGNFTEAIKQAQNMATVLGKDLPSAANTLGHALQNPRLGWLELAQAGVMFTANEKEAIRAMVEANDIAGAQKVILQALDQQFNNAAKDAGDTFVGSIEKLHNSFASLAATVGEAVTPLFQKGVDIVQKWVDNVNDVGSQDAIWKELEGTINGVADAAKSLAVALKAVAVGWGAIKFIGGTATFVAQKGAEKAVDAFSSGRTPEGTKAPKTNYGSDATWEFLRQTKGGMLKDTDAMGRSFNSIGKSGNALSRTLDEINARRKKEKEDMERSTRKEKTAKDYGWTKGNGNERKKDSEEALAAQRSAEEALREMKIAEMSLGLNQFEKTALDARNRGATAGQEKDLKKWGAILQGKQMQIDLQTPVEKFNMELDKLTNLFNAHGIDQATFDRGKAKLTGDLRSQLPDLNKRAGANDINSVEARSNMLAAESRQITPLNAIKMIQQQALEQVRQQNVWLRAIAQNNPIVAAAVGL